MFDDFMNPGLPEKYREKTGEKRLVKCKGCNYVMATRMKYPQCSKCGMYAND